MLEVVYRILPVVNEIKSITNPPSTFILFGHGNQFRALDFVLKGLMMADFPSIPIAPNGSLTIYRDIHLDRDQMSIDMYHQVLAE